MDLYQKMYNNNKTIPVILVVGVLAGLLITATTAMMPSNALAKHHYHNKIKFQKEYRHKSEATAASSAAAASEDGAAAASSAAAAVGGRFSCCIIIRSSRIVMPCFLP